MASIDPMPSLTTEAQCLGWRLYSGQGSSTQSTCVHNTFSNESFPLDDERVKWLFSSSSCDLRATSEETINKRAESVRRAYESVKECPVETVTATESAVRQFHNWLKASLFERAAQYFTELTGRSTQLKVLDVGAGKGGDLFKWMNLQNASVAVYTAIDLVPSQLSDAMNRYGKVAKRGFDAATFLNGDIRHPDVWNRLRNKKWDGMFSHKDISEAEINEQFADPPVFDIVSLQFVLHYVAETGETLRAVLAKIRHYMHSQSVLIATYPDARMLGYLYRYGSIEKQEKIEHGGSVTVTHPMYRVDYSRDFSIDRAYKFQFGGQQVQGAEEYVIPHRWLAYCAAYNGLECDECVSGSFPRIARRIFASGNSSLWAVSRSLAHKGTFGLQLTTWEDVPRAVLDISVLYFASMFTPSTTRSLKRSLESSKREKDARDYLPHAYKRKKEEKNEYRSLIC
jgi:SAM-dependent methyltransferase